MKSKKIKILYYAILRDQSCRKEETLETSANNAHDLYDELKNRYQFSLSTEVVHVAINNVFSDWKTDLQSGDEVVFIPPVAGG